MLPSKQATYPTCSVLSARNSKKKKYLGEAGNLTDTTMYERRGSGRDDQGARTGKERSPKRRTDMNSTSQIRHGMSSWVQISSAFTHAVRRSGAAWTSRARIHPSSHAVAVPASLFSNFSIGRNPVKFCRPHPMYNACNSGTTMEQAGTEKAR
jgi:hypothetical protein